MCVRKELLLASPVLLLCWVQTLEFGVARGATLFSTALHHDEVTDSQLMTIRACSLKLATAGRSSCTNYDMYNANVV